MTKRSKETSGVTTDKPLHVAFVCVQNAGRSQMAYAFAEQERDQRNGVNHIGLLTGGTQPADHVHDIVVEAMREAGFDISDRTPQKITPEDLQDVDIVITMGCSADDVCPMTWRGDARDWDLDDPHGQDVETVRDIRDEIQRRVTDLFDELTDTDAPERASER